MLSFLAALQQADSGFPNGSFAFSNGLEGMVALGQRLDRDGLLGLFETMLTHRWAKCDRAILAQAWRADGDMAALAALDEHLEAASLASSLREGSRAGGAALVEAHARLGSERAAWLKQGLAARKLLGHLPVMQGALWRARGMSETESVLVAGYLAVSGLGACAVRLGAAGALGVQAALADAMPLIARLAAQEPPTPDALAGALPWLDIACAHQASARLRLFAN